MRETSPRGDSNPLTFRLQVGCAAIAPLGRKPKNNLLMHTCTNLTIIIVTLGKSQGGSAYRIRTGDLVLERDAS